MTAAVMLPHMSQALAVYQSVDRDGLGSTQPNTPSGSDDFGALLSRALDGAISTGEQAESQSMQAIAGGGDITSVVTAVSRAQLALQTTVAIRDRVLQAYQDIIKMPI
jgi:flagellar hook-basal body complex protein FliE